jgi:hypothetical protein
MLRACCEAAMLGDRTIIQIQERSEKQGVLPARATKA